MTRAGGSLGLRSLALRSASVLVGTAAALVIGEIIVRVLPAGSGVHVVYHGKFQLSDNPVLGYELQPGSRDGEFAISSAGLRDREFPVAKPPDVFRIVVLGDSVTFGFNLSQDGTYPRQLETLLNRSTPFGSLRYEVLNVGVTGYNTTQIVETLRERGLRYEPDLIIYGYVLNDPQAFSLEGAALAELKRRAEQRLTEARSRGLFRFLSGSRLLQLLAARIHSRAHNQRPLHLEDPGIEAFKTGTYEVYLRTIHEDEPTWARVREGLATLARLASGPRPIPVLVAVFPIDDGRGFTPYPLSRVHAQVIAEAGRNGLHALDLTSAYRVAYEELGEELYLDHLHPNGIGSRVAARALLKWCCESGYLPGGRIDCARVLGGRKTEAQNAAVLSADETE